MCQHDLHGRRGFLDELWERWNKPPAPIRRWRAEGKSALERQAADRLLTRTWNYHRIGHDQRPIRFARDGTITTGTATLERFWDIRTIESAARGEENADLTRNVAKELDGEAKRSNRNGGRVRSVRRRRHHHAPRVSAFG